MSEEIIAGKIALGDRVELYVDDGNRIAFRKLLPEKPVEPHAHAGGMSRIPGERGRLRTRSPFFSACHSKNSFALVSCLFTRSCYIID